VAEVPHQLVEPVEPARVLGLVVLGELHQQQRVGPAAHVGVHHRAEHGDVARQLDQGAVDHLHRHRPQPDDVLGGLHGLSEGGEMADAQHLVPGQRRQLQFDPPRDGQRALRAAQQRRQVHRPGARHQRVDQIPTNPPRHLGKRMRDVRRLTPPQREQVAEQGDAGRTLSKSARRIPLPPVGRG
jgi:hypothetical protein